jgi:dipeptidyl aminopeptidase/acylaminoacyl peptidase
MSAILPHPIPSLEKKVDPLTPPTFIFSTSADELVPVENSLQFAIALEQARIPFEMHIFQDGVHGLALAKPQTSSGWKKFVDPHAAQWMTLCTAWLEKTFGEFESGKAG